jgi:hypothetical protein
VPAHGIVPECRQFPRFTMRFRGAVILARFQKLDTAAFAK